MIDPYLRNLWRWKCDVQEQPVARRLPDIDELRRTEYCGEIDRYARRRFIMGAFRYGLMAEQDYSKYDLVGEVRHRLELYEASRNLEHLVDARNIVDLCFIAGARRGERVEAADDGRHTPERV